MWETDKYSQERYKAIMNRCSRRTYRAEPGRDEMEKLTELAAFLSGNAQVRVAVAPNAGGIFEFLPGGYGTIKGTMAAAAFFAPKGDHLGSLKAGYAGELFVLDATAMGIGTCWTAGSYSPSRARKLFGQADRERLICVTPLGIPAEEYTAVERFTETTASGKSRKTLETLCSMISQEIETLPEWQRAALNAARIAPSAMNKQPWKFTPMENGIRIDAVAVRLPMSEIDFGIAMLHMELGANSCGVRGRWKLLNRPGVAEFLVA